MFSYYGEMRADFYYTTAGLFVETGLLTESESRKMFIIDGTCPLYTTAGSFIETSLLTEWLQIETKAQAARSLKQRLGIVFLTNDIFLKSLPLRCSCQQ